MLIFTNNKFVGPSGGSSLKISGAHLSRGASPSRRCWDEFLQKLKQNVALLYKF